MLDRVLLGSIVLHNEFIISKKKKKKKKKKKEGTDFLSEERYPSKLVC